MATAAVAAPRDLGAILQRARQHASDASARPTQGAAAPAPQTSLSPRSRTTGIDDLAARARRAVDEAASLNTKAAESSAWRWWLPFCEAHDLPTYRPAPDAPGFSAPWETSVQHAFVMWVCERMKPRAAADPGPKPASALAVVAGVRRVHERAGRPMAPAPGLDALSRSLELALVRAHGTSAVAASRKDPLTREHILAIRARCAGALLLGSTVEWEQPYWLVFWMALLTTWQSGMRLSDALTTPGTPFHAGRLSRASLTFTTVNGVRYAELATPTTKADRLGKIWHHRPFVFVDNPAAGALNIYAGLTRMLHAVPVADE
jgi:hypothetical protein